MDVPDVPKHTMVIWKEKEQELDDSQAINEPNTMLVLQECELLKLFKVPSMRAQIMLLEYILKMWNPKQKTF